jgi:hypothetical protein
MTKLLKYFEEQSCLLLFGLATACVTASLYEMNLPTRVSKKHEILDIAFEKEYKAARILKLQRESEDAKLMSPYTKNGNISPSVSERKNFPMVWETNFIDRNYNDIFKVEYTAKVKWPY